MSHNFPPHSHGANRVRSSLAVESLVMKLSKSVKRLLVSLCGISAAQRRRVTVLRYKLHAHQLEALRIQLANTLVPIDFTHPGCP